MLKRWLQHRKSREKVPTKPAGTRRILYVLHADYSADAAELPGGTQRHVRDLISALPETWEPCVAAREGETLRVIRYTWGQDPDDPDGARGFHESGSLEFSIGPEPMWNELRVPSIACAFDRLIQEMHIDLIHVHHLKGLSLDVFDVAAARSVPIVNSFHDFYCVCPNWNMFDVGMGFCDSEAIDGSCSACLERRFGHAFPTDAVDWWRREFGAALSGCSALFAPSEATANVVRRLLPGIGRIEVIPHGIAPELPLEACFTPLYARPKVDPRVEVFLDSADSLDDVRGWAVLHDSDNTDVRTYLEVTDADGSHVVLPYREARPDVQAHFGGGNWYANRGFALGMTDRLFAHGPCSLRILLQQGTRVLTDGKSHVMRRTELPPHVFNVAVIGVMVPIKGSQLVAQAAQLTGPNIHWTVMGKSLDPGIIQLGSEGAITRIGSYRQEMLRAMLHALHIDCVCILSQVFESYSYTLSEALAAGIPVVVTDMGALPDRVHEAGCGLVVPYDIEPARLARLIDELAQGERGLATWRANATAYEPPSIESMTAAYVACYEHCVDPARLDATLDGLTNARPTGNA